MGHAVTTGYLILADLKSAHDRSKAEAAARGCKPGDVTQEWWAVAPHPTLVGQALVLIDDGRPDFDKSKLTTGEKALVGADPAVLAALVSVVTVDGK